jgi:hypothetical protein
MTGSGSAKMAIAATNFAGQGETTGSRQLTTVSA